MPHPLSFVYEQAFYLNKGFEVSRRRTCLMWFSNSLPELGRSEESLGLNAQNKFVSSLENLDFKTVKRQHSNCLVTKTPSTRCWQSLKTERNYYV